MDLVLSVARRLAIPLGLLLLVVLVYWKLALPGPQYVWFDHYDMCQLEVPRLQFLARNLHQGRFPLWEPHIWAGQPVLGAGQPGPLYPLNLLFLALPLEEGALSVATLNWLFIAMHFVGAGFFYLLCRDHEVCRTASVFGAIAYSCAGYAGSIPWLDIGNGLTWTPLIFLFALRLWTGRTSVGNAAMLGVALGASWLSGHHEIPLINSYAVLLGSLALSVFRLVRSRRLDFRLPALIPLALVLAAAISAVQTLPLWEFGREAVRWVSAPAPIGWQERVPYSVHAQYSLPWKGILGLVIPATDPTVFVGLTVTLLATFGILHSRSQRWLFLTAMLGLAGLVYSLGANTPLHRLLYEVLPMLDKARTPERGMFLVTFAISVLAAYGAHLVLQYRPRLQVIAGAILVALLLVEIARVSGSRMTPFTPAQSVCATELFAHRDLAKRLRADPGLGRISVNWQELMTNLGDLYGFDQLQSFVAGVPANVFRHELHTVRTQQLFGVTHHVGKTAVAADDVVLATYGQGLHLFRKPGALPRAWVTHEVLRVASDRELRQAVQNRDLDLSRTTVVLGAVPTLEPCSGSEPVEVVRPNTDAVILRSKLQCRGLMVLSDAYYPGWRAAVDGKPAVIHEVYGAFRGVVVEAGEHTVEMRYQPSSVRIGAAITLAAILIAALLLVGIFPARRQSGGCPLGQLRAG